MLNLILLLLIIGRFVYIKIRKREGAGIYFFDYNEFFLAFIIVFFLCFATDAIFFSSLFFEPSKLSKANDSIAKLEYQMENLRVSFVSETLENSASSEEELTKSLDEFLEDYISLQTEIYDIEGNVENLLITSEYYSLFKFLVYLGH